MTDRLEWWEKLPLALATTAQSVVVGFWYYRYIDLGIWQLNIIIAVIAGLALDAIVVTTIMGRRVGRDSRWSMGASFGAFICSALIAVDSYSTWLAPIRPLLHVSYPAMVLLYSQHLATARHTPASVATAIQDTTPLAPIVRKLADGFVYFLRSDDGLHKIGRAVDVDARVRSIAAFVPFAVQVVHTIRTDNMVRLERGLHRAYESAGKRVNGEWFRLTDDDVDLLRSLGDELVEDATETALEVVALLASPPDMATEDMSDPLIEKKRRAAEMRADNKSWREIAMSVGRSSSTVRDWLAPPTSNGKEH